MVLAVVLQLAAVAAFVVGGFLVARFGGALMAGAVAVFLVGWTLEQRRGG